MAREFTIRRVEQLRKRAEKTLAGLFDDLQAGPQPADLVSEIALRLPILVAGDLLGVSESDRKTYRDWVLPLLDLNSDNADQGLIAAVNLAAYVRELVEQRKRNPTDDLLGALVRANDDEDRLTDDELVAFGMILLLAGFETVADQMSIAVYLLLTKDGQYRRLCNHPELVSTAVEEIVRYAPVTAGILMPYVAKVDVEIGGVTIRADDTVVLSNISANRDSSVFVDPDEFDLARTPNPHFGFAHGTHHCLGAQLARMQLQVFLTMLPQRLPELSLAVPPDDVRWKRGMFSRGPEELPITW
ncbi:cytochrome P450 [Nocardia sp. NPDC049190]|uniref:cytochrome P450 n=1 Tax=Nocardia sp. NPDC049190 TaxID=3155650 RepID=UPI0033C7B697